LRPIIGKRTDRLWLFLLDKAILNEIAQIRLQSSSSSKVVNSRQHLSSDPDFREQVENLGTSVINKSLGTSGVDYTLTCCRVIEDVDIDAAADSKNPKRIKVIDCTFTPT
jgi:hypothetical protein